MPPFTPSTVTYQPPEGTTPTSICDMSRFIQGKPITLYRHASSIYPSYSAVEPIANIDSSYGFFGDVALNLSGGCNIPGLENKLRAERPRQMHSVTVRRRHPLASTQASSSSRFQQDSIVSEDGVFRIPRTRQNKYEVSWDAGTYDVEVLGANFWREGKVNRITGFTAQHWSQIKVNVQGHVGGGYTDELQREWKEDGGTAEPIGGSMMAHRGPERWHTVYPVDKDPQLQDMVDGLVAFDEE